MERTASLTNLSVDPLNITIYEDKTALHEWHDICCHFYGQKEKKGKELNQ